MGQGGAVRLADSRRACGLFAAAGGDTVLQVRILAAASKTAGAKVIGDNLLRLTIGLGDERGLVDDLDRAFQGLGAAAS